MLNRPYVRDTILGILILSTVFGVLYLVLGMSGHVPFSAVAFMAVLIFAVPGGAVVGASFAADRDPRDD
jgi:hypothetical protein